PWAKRDFRLIRTCPLVVGTSLPYRVDGHRLLPNDPPNAPTYAAEWSDSHIARCTGSRRTAMHPETPPRRGSPPFPYPPRATLRAAEPKRSPGPSRSGGGAGCRRARGFEVPTHLRRPARPRLPRAC